MATTANLSSIIRYYAEKQKSPFIDFREFCAYIKKYAEHHVEEQADLVKYLGNPSTTVDAELQGLSQKHVVAVITMNNKKMIIAISFLAIKYAERYKEILKNSQTPFPITSDLPKQFPDNALEKQLAAQYISERIGQEPSKSTALYILEFSKEVPALLMPACVPVSALIEAAQRKIWKILKKEESHDFYLKKLRTTNPTKEISLRHFFEHFVDVDQYKYMEFTEGDDYYIWNQTLYYIRQDYEKIQDRTIEDINILQAAQILEIQCTNTKEKMQEQQVREEALKELESNLAKPPFFYSMNQILKFQDQSGRLLYGRYSEDDLKEFLRRMTTEGKDNELPPLLVFKIASGTRYYVYKKKVIQVIVRLCNEAHGAIETELEARWHNSLLNYERLPEMTNASEFEACLHEMVERLSPTLYSLLNANFITLLAYEKDDDETQEGFHLFVDGKLMSYSELLMLKNTKIFQNARSRLPFIYTIPILSWLISMFHGKKKQKLMEQAIAQKNSSENSDSEKSESAAKQKSKPEALASRAKEISKELIPEGSTLDRELNYLVKQWNQMISKEAYNNLTEDVNSLIRDYTRRVVRTLTATTFTKERIENLANTLVNTPNMQKIKDQKALTEYVILYMLRLVTNTK